MMMLKGMLFLMLSSAWGFVAPPSRRCVVPQQRKVVVMMAGETLVKSKKRVIEAVDELGGRVTAADVAGAGAVDLVSSERELLELAARFGGLASLDTTESGDVVFDFGRSPSKTLATVDRRERWLRRWQAVKPNALAVGRGAFGLCLFASLAVVSLALTVASSSSSSNDDRRSSSSSGGGGFYISPYLYMDLLSPPRYGVYRANDGLYYPSEEKKEMNFLQAIFSYVFGDGDPNAEIRARELEAAASIIRANDGVVVAEQLAPVVANGPPSSSFDNGQVNVDESWVLPIVSSLGGRPEVVDDTIVYVFDDLTDGALNAQPEKQSPFKRVASLVSSQKAPPQPLTEVAIPFSKANQGQLLAAGALGVANLLAVGVLAAKVAAKPAILRAFPILQPLALPLVLYAVSYNVVPLIRNFRNPQINKAIDQRNLNRRRAAAALERPPPSLRQKLQAANNAAKDALLRKRRTIDSKVAFSTTNTNSKNQQLKGNTDLDTFDKKLQQRRDNKN